MIDFELDDVRLEAPLVEHWDALLRVVGHLSVSVGGRRWYADADACVVELADALAWWRGQAGARPFEYRSLESAAPWLLRFSPAGSVGWRVDAFGEEFRDTSVHDLHDLQAFAASYLDALSARLPEREAVRHLLASEPERYRELLAALSAHL